MTFTTPIKLQLAALLTVLAVALIAAIPAGAIVPPRKCGSLKINGKSYRVVADQIPCPERRVCKSTVTVCRWAAAYIRSRSVPRYYTCKPGPSGSSLWRTCSAKRYNPDREFKIIKR